MAKIYITDLRLRTIIGVNDWERDAKQDIVINVTIDFDMSKAAQSDDLQDTVDYNDITKKIIKEVEASKFFLLEKLAGVILNIVLEYPLVEESTVRIDKPNALPFADSVSVELSKKKEA
ncbi:Dihydroneopterin aldolase [hydrothermal vent metagenome]|uniref:Dihydroneopterin triphosphate 2'-epimerase n=1 Tax=hydrothermal vent metagenome TaxID=652676 RepID=A0A3B1D8K4_9ZZZZ